jgi:hypothetical protein
MWAGMARVIIVIVAVVVWINHLVESLLAAKPLISNKPHWSGPCSGGPFSLFEATDNPRVIAALAAHGHPVAEGG